jgi:hypothetical protein
MSAPKNSGNEKNGLCTGCATNAIAAYPMPFTYFSYHTFDILYFSCRFGQNMFGK